MTRSRGAIEAGSEGRSRRRSAGQSIRRSPSRIVDRERRTRLQGDYAAGLPSPERRPGRAAAVSKERQLVDGAGYKALPPVEIRKAAGSSRVVLIIHPCQKRHRGSGHVINRFRPRISALEIKPLAQMVSQSGLQGAVMRVGVGRKVFEISRSYANIR